MGDWIWLTRERVRQIEGKTDEQAAAP